MRSFASGEVRANTISSPPASSRVEVGVAELVEFVAGDDATAARPPMPTWRAISAAVGP